MPWYGDPQPIRIFCPINQLEIFYLENNQDQLLQQLNASRRSNENSPLETVTRGLTEQEAHDLGEFVIICNIGINYALEVYTDWMAFNRAVHDDIILQVYVVHKTDLAQSQTASTN